MQKLSSLSLSLFLGAASFQVASPARAAETAAQKAGRAAITRAYRQQDAATVKRDVATLMSYIAPDFQMHLSGGQVINRAQTETMMRQLLSGAATGVPLTYTKATTRIVSLTWRGADAIVVCETKAVGTARGPRTMKFEQSSAARDFWSPTSQGWKVRQSVETSSKMWLEGKRIR